MSTGDYINAYDLLIDQYAKDMSAKNRAKFLPVFQRAYLKMVESQEAKIENLKSAKNPSYYGDIYETLANLNFRQEKLRSYLPIYHNGKTLSFPTKNYQSAIIQAKNDYVAYLYQISKDKINHSNKSEIRTAHSNLKKIQQLSPGYKDVEQMVEQSHFRGTDFVFIKIENSSNQMLPKRLEEDLTKIDTYNLNNYWTEFHQKTENNIEYDYLIEMDIEHILVSPERLNSRRHNLEKEIVDGWEYLYRDGEQVLDSIGNPIKVDIYKTVSARVEEKIQEKDAMVQGRVQLINLRNNQVIDRQKLNSEFAFRNHFAQYFGDIQALDEPMMQLIKNRFIPFPSHEQMVYDCGEEIKSQLRQMLKRRF